MKIYKIAEMLSHFTKSQKGIEEIVGDFKRNFGSLKHQVCERNLTIKIMSDWLTQALSQAQEQTISLARKEVLDEVEKLIIEEINTAHREGTDTSRLTSLYNKIQEIK